MSEEKQEPTTTTTTSWHRPSHAPRDQLLVRNSLSTNELVPFVTIDPAQKHVKWYICGPTVYDSAHLGHARAYMTFDIIRRVLERYFGYEVNYVMNITDVDDKIILRARENHLFDEFMKTLRAMPNTDESFKHLVTRGTEAFAAVDAKKSKDVLEFEAKLKENTNSRDRKDLEDRLQQAEMKLEYASKQKSAAETVVGDYEAKRLSGSEAFDAYSTLAKEVIAQRLDAEQGSSVTDKNIFRAHAAFYEAEFLQDMQDLNIQPPTTLTRVTEYVEQICAYVQRIIDNGYAYEADGNVYFDVPKFQAAHEYAKLSPQSRGNLDLVEDGEGALGATSGKKHPSDFALWKRSKRGEPAWSSPWGEGRPGWHIECSVMASDHLGAQMDIHSGGVDLKFPHHDNELAQAEAHYKCQQWVNYFLHAGHLHIHGMKMSKSLKNFTTIRALLNSGVTARQIRILFLLSPWDKSISFSEATLDDARAKERTFREFFLNLRAVFRSHVDVASADQVWNSNDRALHEHLLSVQSAVHQALCNNFDTGTAVSQLLSMVTKTNLYLKDITTPPKVLLLQQAAVYVHRMLSMFGVMSVDELAWQGGGSGGDGDASREEVVAPLLDALAEFRDAVRDAAKLRKESSVFLKLSDELRDTKLTKLGVRLEDVVGAPSVWKLVDVAELQAEQEEKERQAREKTISKLERSIAARKLEVVKAQSDLVAPRARFEAEGYTQFNDDGMPTHDTNGEPLAKSAIKKMNKRFQQMKKAYDQAQAKITEDVDYFAKKESETAADEQELEKLIAANSQ